MLQISVMATEIVGGSPPADIDIYVVPDMLQTEISVTTTEMAGGSPPANIDICVVPDVLPTAISVKSVMSDKSSGIDTPDAVVSRMERFVINPKVLCSNGLAPDDDPARRNSDVGSDACVIQDPIPTAVSMRTVVTGKLMDRFVLDLVECPSVSRTSAVARTFGAAVSEEYSPVVFCWGGGRLPMHTPGCRRVRYSSGVWPTVG